MTAHIETCVTCGEKVSGEVYHLGFSDIDALYCSSCPSVLILPGHGVTERHGITIPSTDAASAEFQYYCRHLLPAFAKIEALFDPCKCGGRYGYMNPPRCPKCSGLLRGDIYEDKPIFKLNDLYVFVSGGTVDESSQLACP
jgi:hypothetical protein